MIKQLFKDAVASRLRRQVLKLLAVQPNLKLIGVTGSVGKTSTKVAIGSVLSKQFNVSFSEDSYNTDIGLPLAIFGIKVPNRLYSARAWKHVFNQIDQLIADFPYEVVVIELADDELAMMKKFLRGMRLDICVISAVAPVHMARMISMDRIVDHVWTIARHANVVLYNQDQPELAVKANAHAVGFGLNNGDVRLMQVSRHRNGYLTATLSIDGKHHTIATKLIGQQTMYCLAAAAATGVQLGMKPADIVKGLQAYVPPKGRMNLLQGVNGSMLIDDSYNASPESVIAALDVLNDFKGTKIAVLGQMNELGDYSAEGHEKVGRHVAKIADLLVVVGKDAQQYMVPAALDAGLDNTQIKIFRSPYEAGHYLKSAVKKGNSVLIKGSQDGVYTEEVTRILLDHKLKPADVLVRQGSTWQRRKKKSFTV